MPSLNLVAQLLTNGNPLFNQRRQALRYKHTAAIRAALVNNYEPATVNFLTVCEEGEFSKKL